MSDPRIADSAAVRPQKLQLLLFSSENLIVQRIKITVIKVLSIGGRQLAGALSRLPILYPVLTSTVL